MTKYKYPSNGLYKPNKNHLDLARNNASSAVTLCSFNVPSNFSYRSYIASLRGKINNIKNEINIIEGLMKKNDYDADNLSQDLSLKVKSVPQKKIKERERRII